MELDAPHDVGSLKASSGQAVKLSRIMRPLTLAALAAGPLLMAPTQAQAGLLDFLFGGGAQRAPQQYAPPPSYGRPLDVRVNPQRRKKNIVAKKARPTKERSTRVVNRSINPKDHPNWFLEDPTLRRGDIVVLPTGVMVYNGGAKPQTREDFTKLRDSRLVSKKERERIERMAGPPSVTAEADSPSKGKEAAGQANPIQ